MGSVSLSTNYNGIDWTSLLNAVIQQESQPLTTLSNQRRTLQYQATTYASLASNLATLQSAVEDLASVTAFQSKAATNSDETVVSVTTSTETTSGTYDITVNELARAQVTASNSAHADRDTTSVATGGTLTIGGTVVTISASVTLDGLADAINATDGIGVVATVVQSGASSYQLVLTGKNTGTANAFTITNALTAGAAPVTFIDTDLDGTTGDSALDNAVQATNASVTVNNITVTSETNTIEDAIPGASIEALKKTASATISVTQDLEATKTAIDTFVTAYNDFIGFTNDQITGARNNVASSIGRDGLLRTLKNTLNAAVLDDYAAASGSTYARLSEIGLGFERDGTLSFDTSVFDSATASGADDVQKLFAGNDDANTGAFDALQAILEDYTEAGGLLPTVQDRLDDQVQSMADRIDAMQKRIDIRRAALQREYMAADQAMTELKSQAGSLSTLSGQYRLF